MNLIRKNKAWAALAGLLLVAGTATAVPVITGPAGVAMVGDNLVYTVSDNNPADGVDIGTGFYAADFSFDYDPLVMQYLLVTQVALLDLLVAPDLGLGDPDPAGLLTTQAVAFTVPAAGDLFTITFLALAPSTGTEVRFRVTDGGVYGSSGAITGFIDKVTLPISPSNIVPEPEGWALALLAGAIAAGFTRRSRRPAQH